MHAMQVFAAPITKRPPAADRHDPACRKRVAVKRLSIATHSRGAANGQLKRHAITPSAAHEAVATERRLGLRWNQALKRPSRSVKTCNPPTRARLLRTRGTRRLHRLSTARSYTARHRKPLHTLFVALEDHAPPWRVAETDRTERSPIRGLTDCARLVADVGLKWM
jgi:hypothetical protein